MRSVFAVLMVLVAFILAVVLYPRVAPSAFQNIPAANVAKSPDPSPIVLKQALPRDAYTIIMLGDSMTESLGPNSDKLREYLKINYPNKVFGIYNLAKGSTNVLSAQDILDKDVIPSREFEVIFIESFGYNPLPDASLEEGLKKQTQALDKIVSSIRIGKMKAKVNPIIVFVATIAPNRENYGKNAVDLSPEERARWADERSAYIRNHIEYAKSHDIPVIDVYDKSLTQNGDGDMQYIKGDTFIHPSAKGIELISKEIADFLLNNKVLLN